MKDYRRRVRGGNYELRRDLTKNKKATKKTKNKEEIFGRTTTLIFGVISLVTLTSIAVNPNTLKSSISYLTDLARQVQTVQNVSAQEYAELKNPVVEPESNMHPKVIPVVLHEATPSAEVAATLDLPAVQNEHTKYILTKINAPQLLKVWRKESNRGGNKNPQALHNYCKAQGLSNEFGYGGMALKLCFSDFEAAVDRIDKWFTDNNLPENQALCRYNTGKATNVCTYLSL